MVIIFSQDFEPSTNDVIDWIAFRGFKFKRINKDNTRINSLRLKFNNNELEASFEYKGEHIFINEFSSYWYRRGGIPALEYNRNSLRELFGNRFLEPVLSVLQSEITTLYDYFYHILRKRVKKIGDPTLCSVNKLIVLDVAKEVGLKIPPTLVSTEKKHFQEFNSNHKSSITKSISGNTYIKDTGYTGHYFSYTEPITRAFLKQQSPTFFPSLAQKNLRKDFEVRTFFLAGKCYSMAIFSQKDNQTKIDFRKYNTEKPNRTVPYKLPSEIESKIDQLMKRLELESGSIDIIVNGDDHYFLEVNPVGQFGMVSLPCNYYLEKIIAEYLTTE